MPEKRLMSIKINFEAFIIVRKANFITWYKDESPDITAENLRDVTRMADARGKQVFEDFDVPPVDLTAADEKTCKKESTTSISKDEGDKRIQLGSKLGQVWSLAKNSRSKTPRELTISDPSQELKFGK